MAYKDNTREIAAFNLALPYLQRVNSVLNNSYVEFKRGNIGGFAINLRQLFRELRPWLSEDRITDGIGEVTSIKKKFEALAKIKKQEKEKIWEQMEEIEMELRIHFKALGMLMPKLDDPRYLFGNMKQK
jgi:hypothetical protein